MCVLKCTIFRKFILLGLMLCNKLPSSGWHRMLPISCRGSTEVYVSVFIYSRNMPSHLCINYSSTSYKRLIHILMYICFVTDTHRGSRTYQGSCNIVLRARPKQYKYTFKQAIVHLYLSWAVAHFLGLLCYGHRSIN